MTSDNSNNTQQFFARQQYGRQSLDNSKIHADQKRQRLRKSETASKSEENLSESTRKEEATNGNCARLSHLSNSFEHFDNLNNRVPQTCDTYSRNKSESCDNVNRDRTSVKVVSYRGPPPVSESVPSNYHAYIPVSVDITTERPTPYIQRTALTMEPVHPHSDKASRPFTSVNLILRPPSSEPQSPIDIVMQGSSITYSTYSTNPNLGYESQLEINFRPAGQSSAMASRLKPLPITNENANQSTQLVISEQIKRKQNLEEALQFEINLTLKLNQEIKRMEAYLCSRQSTLNKLAQVKQDIVSLTAECALWKRVDSVSNERVPLGDSNEDYNNDVYYEIEPSSVLRSEDPAEESQSTEEVQWACHMCTLKNNALLLECEACAMPRLNFETSITATTSSRPRPSPTNIIRSTAMSSNCTLQGSCRN